jgi:hypothetical protein
MPADIAQELDIVELQQPIGIVDHDGVGRPVAVTQDCETRLMLSMFWRSARRQQLALIVAEGGSPTIEVPPPISVIGRWPVSCSQ